MNSLVLQTIRFRYELSALKNQIFGNLLLLEKEEIKRNEELCRKYRLLNGYDSSYYYDIESDMFKKYDTEVDEESEIAIEQEEEEKEEIIVKIYEKIEQIFCSD